MVKLSPQQMQKFIDSLTSEEKKKFVEGVEQRYIDEFNNNLSHWISVHDMIDFVMNEKKGVFITYNDEVKDIYNKIKKSKIRVVTMQEYIKEHKIK